MPGYRRYITVGAVAAFALLGAGTALAATPQQIYRDMADNGLLDGKYTDAELARAFDLRQVRRTDTRPGTPRKPIGVAPSSEGTAAPTATTRTNRRVPFSTLDAALLLAGGGPLLLIAAGLRRRLGAAPTEAPVTGG